MANAHPEPSDEQSSPMMRLRQATWPSHQRLEKQLDVKTRFSELGAYRNHLRRMWGFCAVVEEQLELGTFGGALPDYETRRKLPLLSRDLAALEVEPPASPRRSGARRMKSTAAAFGCAYVLEGATLGGQVLLPLVKERLGFTAEHGAAFLASYGEQVPAMWQRFSTALNAWCYRADRRAQAVEAAIDTFDALDEWLLRAPQ